MDHGIGRIVEAIDRRGLRENTLIVFVSDNGGQREWSSSQEYKGRYGDKPHVVLGNNRPLRGWKGEVYEGGIRVPALANWPGVLRARQLETPVHIVDWMPTLCSLAGYSPGRDLAWDGCNVWSAIQGDAAPDPSRSFYWRTPNSFAVRRGDWKLVVRKQGGEPQLYDLAVDPYETKDLARQHPDRVSELDALLKEYSAKDR
jgi:arylsulfatase A-like enzyme